MKIVAPKTSLLLLVFIGVFLAAIVHAASGPETIENLEVEILNQQKKVYRLNKGIQDHKSRIRDSRSEEINFLTELERLDANLKEEREKLAKYKKELDEQEKLIKIKQEELVEILTEKETIQTHVEKRLTAYYQLGSIGVMNVVFSSAKLPDLLTFNEYFRHLMLYDQEVIASYREKIKSLSETRDTLQEGIKQLMAVIKQIKQQEMQLAETRQERMVLLTRINTEKKLYQQALLEMEEASVNLTSTIDNLKKQASTEKQKLQTLSELPKKRPPGPSHGFGAQKGRLDPPIPGTVTTYFGRNKKGKFGITTYANGIDIKSEAGNEITSIYSGKVVYAGHLRGYGNLMIIDHGQQYYSLTSRAAQFFKKENEHVATGEVIGIMGDQGGLLGEGLHFEIRHGSKPENPLHWVNNAKLKIKATRSQ
ncbi:MAG: peptidoglycan DD-metalloendopeptidase family protein [Proteobacteria bacterium]|nr:peptidoglycan DD-metalloendopeptidase family protein [Pseudomonadota bacterium]MBU1710548.1 peptidoglycan DD-metalloendopeptidase family protein [Pseudomonadota bacterium]